MFAHAFSVAQSPVSRNATTYIHIDGMFVYTFSVAQYPGLSRLLDLSLANITAELDCWRFFKLCLQGSSSSNVCVVLMDLLFILVFVCSTLFALSSSTWVYVHTREPLH